MRLMLFILLFFSYTLKSQFHNQYFDGFNINPYNSLIIEIDTTDTNIWQIGKPQKVLFNNANTTPKAIITDTINYYPINNLSRFSFALPIMGTPWSPIALQWTQKLDLDATDGGIIEFSNDNINWENTFYSSYTYQFYGFDPTNVNLLPSGDPGFTGSDNVWRDVWLCIDPFYAQQNDSLFFRFTFLSDSINTNQEGWMMDNFQGRTTIIHPVKEISQIDDVIVYPNISTGIINIEMKKTKATDVIDNIEMIDESGKVMETFGKNFTKVVLDIKKHKPGLYYFRVTTNNKTKLFKVIYEKN